VKQRYAGVISNDKDKVIVIKNQRQLDRYINSL
jgi:hypothetical protein